MNDFPLVSFFTPSVCSNDEVMDQAWNFDIGASHHLTSNKVILANLVSFIGPKVDMLGNRSTYSIASFDNSTLKARNQDLILCIVLLVH